MAIESYNKSVNEGSMGPIQSAILKLLGDKSLDFDALCNQYMPKNIKNKSNAAS